MGAPRETEYEAKLAAAGFEAISSEPTRVYDIEDERVFLTDKGIAVRDFRAKRGSAPEPDQLSD